MAGTSRQTRSISTQARRRALSMQASTIWQMWWPVSNVGHIARPEVIDPMTSAASMILVSL